MALTCSCFCVWDKLTLFSSYNLVEEVFHYGKSLNEVELKNIMIYWEAFKGLVQENTEMWKINIDLTGSTE